MHKEPTNNITHKLRIILGCSREKMARILGISSKTIDRWEKDEHSPSDLARQKLAELRRVIKKMQGIIKHNQETKWLNTPNEDLNGKTPLEEMMMGYEGVEEVLHLLGRLEWGIMS